MLCETCANLFQKGVQNVLDRCSNRLTNALSADKRDDQRVWV